MHKWINHLILQNEESLVLIKWRELNQAAVLIDWVSNNGHNNISYPICSFAMWSCQSSIKGWSLVPLPLDLDWPCVLFWPIESSQNDAIQLPSLGLKRPAVLPLLLRRLAPGTFLGKEAQAGYVERAIWKVRDRLSLQTILAKTPGEWSHIGYSGSASNSL